MLSKAQQSILILFLAVFTVACNRTENDKPRLSNSNPPLSGEMVNLKGKVESYVKNAMSDTYEDGRFATFDACKIKLINPEEGLPPTITIYREFQHKDENVKQKLPHFILEDEGTVVKFSVPKELLNDNTDIFLGAIKNLTWVPSESGLELVPDNP